MVKTNDKPRQYDISDILHVAAKLVKIVDDLENKNATLTESAKEAMNDKMMQLAAELNQLMPAEGMDDIELMEMVTNKAAVSVVKGDGSKWLAQFILLAATQAPALVKNELSILGLKLRLVYGSHVAVQQALGKLVMDMATNRESYVAQYTSLFAETV
jgi:hypothetical protein